MRIFYFYFIRDKLVKMYYPDCIEVKSRTLYRYKEHFFKFRFGLRTNQFSTTRTWRSRNPSNLWGQVVVLNFRMLQIILKFIDLICTGSIPITRIVALSGLIYQQSTCLSFARLFPPQVGSNFLFNIIELLSDWKSDIRGEQNVILLNWRFWHKILLSHPLLWVQKAMVL